MFISSTRQYYNSYHIEEDKKRTRLPNHEEKNVDERNNKN